MEVENTEATELDIDALQPNPLQPRGQILPDTLVELAESIREHGVLEPLIVAKTPAGYQIIAGERRWRAAKLAGLTRLSVIIRETTPQGMLEMAIVENVQRVDLNPLERSQQGFEGWVVVELYHRRSCQSLARFGGYQPHAPSL